jgi:hypothetical protein
MTIVLDTSFLTPHVLMVIAWTVYVIGWIVATNIARIRANRSGEFMPQHLFGPIIWPAIVLVWFLVLPSTLYLKSKGK